MVLLSKERLQERLRLSRERQEKKKKAEKERREAIKREVLSELKKPKKIKLIKLDDDNKESSKEKVQYSVNAESSIISSILIGDIYETREELMDAEKRGEGKINWEYFDSAVKRVRGIIDKIK